MQPRLSAGGWLPRRLLSALRLPDPGRVSERPGAADPEGGGRGKEGLAGPRGAVLRGKQVRRRARIRRRLGAPSEGSPLWPAQALPLTELRPGQEARVLYIGTDDGRRLEQLSNLGIVPNAVLRLLQKRPASVVQVGETEVAIDFGIARQIYVRPLT